MSNVVVSIVVGVAISFVMILAGHYPAASVFVAYVIGGAHMAFMCRGHIAWSAEEES